MFSLSRFDSVAILFSFSRSVSHPLALSSDSHISLFGHFENGLVFSLASKIQAKEEKKKCTKKKKRMKNHE